jgi:hypothetical protein
VVLRRIFGPKSNEMVQGWSKLHNEELHSLHSLTNIIIMHIKEDEMGKACSMHGEKRNAYKILVRKPEGKTTRGTYI